MNKQEYCGEIRLSKNLVTIHLDKFLGVWFDVKDESMLILTSVTVSKKIYEEYFRNDSINFTGEKITLFISLEKRCCEKPACTIDSYTNSDDGIKRHLINPFEILISNIYITR